MMRDHAESFLVYLREGRNMSGNTVEAYLRDVKEFETFLRDRDGENLTGASNTDLIAYLLALKNDGKSSATVNRKISSLRTFYRYARENGLVSEDPAAHIKAPKIERKEPEYLTVAEVDSLIALPDRSAKGIRDRAILELLYATGLRVSEIIAMNKDDVNLKMGFIICTGEHGKARVIPLGRPARVALEEYLQESRGKLLRPEEHETEALFVNYTGRRATRQGLWKLLKKYAKQAGMEHKITPQTLRNSFAAHMIQNGADLKSLQELMGHEDISATQVYLSVTRNRIKDVYDRTHPRA